MFIDCEKQDELEIWPTMSLDLSTPLGLQFLLHVKYQM
jgi:hypothetical protein